MSTLARAARPCRLPCHLAFLVVFSRRTVARGCIVPCSWRLRRTFEYVLGDNSIYPPRMRIHLMTIKVFTTPRRTPLFEIWRLGPPCTYRQSEEPAISNRRPPPPPSLSPFRSPLLASLRFLFRIPFLVSLPNVHRRRRSAERREVASPSRYTAQPGFSILFTIPRPARRSRNNSGQVRKRASVSPNWWKPRTS